MNARIGHSIGTKIFVAFFAMSVIIEALGASGYLVLASAGRLVVRTYDGPLMAINYARAASLDFVQMQQAVLERRLASAAARPQIDKRIDDLTATFFDDLDVAQQRLQAQDEVSVVRRIRVLVTQWRHDWRESGQSGADRNFTALNAKILDAFDRVVELNADHSFIDRRKAVWAIGDFKYAIIAVTGLSVLLGLAITLLLARQIMRPLRSAVTTANKIAAGEFETLIPKSGADETGVLLHSMSVMQDSIRAMVEREKLRAESAETRLARALETSSEGVVLVGRDGRILLANKKMGDFFPSIAGRLKLGSDFSETLRAARCDLAEGQEFARAPETGDGRKPKSLGSAEYQLRDGRWLRATGSRTEDGCLIFFVSDFTALKEREDNFRRAREAAEAASATKTRFLANISHELRTPLNAIIGFADIICRQMFGEVGNQRYVDYATDIQRSGRHLLDIINSVLEISRSYSGKQLLKADWVELRYVFRDCSKMMADQFADAQVALIVDEPDEGMAVWGEKAKLRQIFLNLLSNAMKFTAPGGNVSVSARRVAGAVVVDIADSGIGMTPEHIQIALTPFGQVDNRLERKYEGTGLGLPLAKSLAELHGGAIEIESVPGTGTIVHIHLPDLASQEIPQTHVAAA
ncbi:MAG TPA: ATP-binding protein [Rhizomicrobium sp.]|nr:ATP-binding protein [Rhizomicrobium sp.]